MLTPRPYQAEAINRATYSSYLLADECGLGKTLTAIETVKTLTSSFNAPALVVIPKSLRAQWVKALTTQGVNPSRIVHLDAKGGALETDPKKYYAIKGAMLIADVPFDYPPVVLTHYEALVKHQAELRYIYFSVIVADEAHKIKNRKAKRTEAIKSLKSFRRLALTGTPFDRNPADVWSILNWLAPDFFTSYWRFFDAHVAYKEVRIPPRRLPNGTVISSTKVPVGVADAERFSRVLRQYSLRRLKSDVRSDLPEKITQIVDVALDPAQQRAYTKLATAEDIVADLGEGVEVAVPIVLTKILRLMQLTTDPSLLEVKAPAAKLEWVEEWVEANPDQPVIIFTRFRDTAIKLSEQLQANTDIEAEPTLILGGKRPTITGSEKLIIGTISAMGEGLDLPWINTAIFIDCEWSSILMTQAVDRIHRINSTDTKHIIYLQAPNTVDELVLSAVQGKWDQMQLVEAFLTGYKE